MEKENNPSSQGTFMNLKELTISGLLAGITIFLGLTGYGFIPLVVMNATILHIPTIIGAVVAGPKVGAIVGLLFGLFSFFQSLRAPSLLLQFALQYNPFYDAFICIVPRICIGLFAYFLYKHIHLPEGIRIGIAAVGGSLCNTVLFLGSFYLLVGAPYAASKGISVEAVGATILGIVGVNGVPEALVSAVIIIPVVLALKHSGFKTR